MNTDFFDAIIIGGGPGGGCTAGYLARSGRRVLLLEKEFFPRFHIGESLLPYNTAIFRDLGLLPALHAAGFPRKTGAQFHLGNGSLSTQFIFSRGVFTREHETVQVERAVFDHIVLKRARELGADAREGWTVQRFDSDADGVSVKAADPDGKLHSFHAKFLIDASGRGNVTGNQENLRVFHPKHKKLSVFGHFTGVQLDPGDRGGDTVIVRGDNKWFWIIPVSPTKTSVGLVIDKDEFTASGQSPEQAFHHWMQDHEAVKKRMVDAKIVGHFQVTSDFSYFNKRYVGHRLLRVGDAAGFMDPIFSAGVFLAMWSGKLAAETVIESLAVDSDGARKLRRYEKRVDAAIQFYWKMVEQYYTTPFIELLMQPRAHHHLPDAVNAVLAGELEPSWSVRWRLRYFYFIVKLQARFGVIVPRLNIGGPARRAKTNSCQCEAHPH